MEKISGILPSNARITTVEVNPASVRSGAPRFGTQANVEKDENLSPGLIVQDRVSLSGALEERRPQDQKAISRRLETEFFDRIGNHEANGADPRLDIQI